MISKFKLKLIRFIANGEPVVLNFMTNPELIKSGHCAVYYPPKNHTLSSKELTAKAVLTPLKDHRQHSRSRNH
jgi:hypothetical protein